MRYLAGYSEVVFASSFVVGTIGVSTELLAGQRYARLLRRSLRPQNERFS
jgi:hypothetical protein